ncbi:hypothetical protein BDQ17DRAFT_1433800 [Cyathus striatus]|nr:hypothetical protein BDQ17DRAFT_1433800 [Cyathus striatus]
MSLPPTGPTPLSLDSLSARLCPLDVLLDQDTRMVSPEASDDSSSDRDSDIFECAALHNTLPAPVPIPTGPQASAPMHAIIHKKDKCIKGPPGLKTLIPSAGPTPVSPALPLIKILPDSDALLVLSNPLMPVTTAQELDSKSDTPLAKSHPVCQSTVAQCLQHLLVEFPKLRELPPVAVLINTSNPSFPNDDGGDGAVANSTGSGYVDSDTGEDELDPSPPPVKGKGKAKAVDNNGNPQEAYRDLLDLIPCMQHLATYAHNHGDIALEAPFQEMMFTLHKAYNLLEKKRLPLPCNQTLYVFDAVKHIHQLWEAQLVHSLPIEEIVVIAANIPALPATPVSAAMSVKQKCLTWKSATIIESEESEGEKPTTVVQTGMALVPNPVVATEVNTTPSAGPSGHPETYSLPYGALTNMDEDSPLYKKYEQLSFRKCTKQETVMSSMSSFDVLDVPDPITDVLHYE